MSQAVPPRSDERELKALLALIDDESEFVRERVEARLRELGREILPIVRSQAELADASARVRIRSLVETIRRDELVNEFAALARAPRFDLERGAFLLARTAYPTVDEESYRKKLDGLADRAGANIGGSTQPRRIVTEFGHALYGPDGMKGTPLESYHDPDNSYVTCVLDRKRGIPISLSAVGLFVADRLRVPFVGVGLPTHFLLAYEAPGERILVNPFKDGEIVTPEECRRHLEWLGVPWKESHLDAVSPRQIMFRMLVNLIVVFQRTNDGAQVELLGRMAALLQQAPPPGPYLTG